MVSRRNSNHRSVKSFAQHANWSTIWSTQTAAHIMTQLQSIGSYETKTHLADVLRRVRLGEGFTITQRGEPVADLVPAGSGARRSSTAAALRMRRFMQDSPEPTIDLLTDAPVNLKELIDAGRD